MKEILFKGKKYIFGGDSLYEDDFIATKKAYSNGEASYAHYYANTDMISRFGERIGGRKDIKILKDIKVSPKKNAFDNLFISKTWPIN